MVTLRTWNGPETYGSLLQAVRDRGRKSAPRGQAVRSLGHTVIEFPDIANAVPVGTGRKLNLKIGAAETAQLIAGVSDLAQLDGVTNGKFSQFSNDNKLLGAYGPRLYTAIPRIIDRLHSDPHTRQAHAGIWSNDDLARADQRDIPCTVGLTFRRDDDGLHMTTIMRSNDVWLGLPYDVWMFTRLQAAVAHALDIPTAMYTHVALDLHLYERNLEASEKITSWGDSTEPQPPFLLPAVNDLTKPYDRWRAVRRDALQAVLGNGRFKRSEPAAGWYQKQLADTHDERLVCLYCKYVQENGASEAHMRLHLNEKDD